MMSSAAAVTCRASNELGGTGSDVDSEEENEEGDYTVYECPGLAPVSQPITPSLVLVRIYVRTYVLLASTCRRRWSRVSGVASTYMSTLCNVTFDTRQLDTSTLCTLCNVKFNVRK